MVIQKKSMPEESESEDWDEESDEEFEEDLDEETPKQIKKPIQVERTNKFSKPEQKSVEDRFVAYHVPTIDGLMDKQTNKMVSQDLWEVLAIILSKLNRIEENLG
jgi:pyruvate/oxaloacetate carboxyltransferase